MLLTVVAPLALVLCLLALALMPPAWRLAAALLTACEVRAVPSVCVCVCMCVCVCVCVCLRSLCRQC
jgi:hypothetical protein